MAGLFSPHARAILWAQFRSIRNRMPRANRAGLVFTILIGIVWYGMFALAGAGAGLLMSSESGMETISRILPGGLLLVFLYWVIIPILMASTGSSLDLRKLLVYPIRSSEFFRLEMLLRLSVGVEALLVTTGAFIGLFFNRLIPWWGPFALLLFVVFTMCFALGVHDLLSRLLARRGVREIVALLFILAVAAPQLMMLRGSLSRFKQLGSVAASPFWPWAAAAQLAQGDPSGLALTVLVGWTAAAYVFGRWQFERTLRFDASASGAPRTNKIRSSRLEWFYRLPNVLFRDPIAALVEKEFRFLLRAPRFRLVFAMGFSFGFLIWWPLAFGRHPGSWMSQNFLAVVSLYAVLLLSEVLFWNAFGFDRGAAQFYFVAPVETRTVLMAKNIAAGFFVLLETTIAAAIGAALRLPLTPLKVTEAYAVTMVAALLLITIGNLTSLYSPRPVDPSKSFRAARSGRVQAIMLLVYPVVAIPVVLAYGARYAFNSEAAFFIVLAAGAAFGLVAYRIAMDSAMAMAVKKRETILTALARSDGPIST
jgi:ABC-2 type transport system permease protein